MSNNAAPRIGFLGFDGVQALAIVGPADAFHPTCSIRPSWRERRSASDHALRVSPADAPGWPRYAEEFRR